MPRKNLLKSYVNDVKKITKLNGFFAGFKYAISEIRLYNRIKEEIGYCQLLCVNLIKWQRCMHRPYWSCSP